MYLKFAIYTIAFYFLFRFIFRVVLPLIRISRAAQARMKEMQERMARQNAGSHQAHSGPFPPPSEKARKKEGEYIEYEEVQ